MLHVVTSGVSVSVVVRDVVVEVIVCIKCVVVVVVVVMGVERVVDEGGVRIFCDVRSA